MMDRCNNPNSDDYKDYGGRGISVCERWRDFINFFEDMGERPKGLSLDRIDNSKGYSKDNCRYASLKEQVRNRRVTVMITHTGETKPLAQWCEELGVSYERADRRYRLGHPPHKILSTEVFKTGPAKGSRKGIPPRARILRDPVTKRFIGENRGC
jgi:hypothetical protein